jgi:hypothetical protein
LWSARGLELPSARDCPLVVEPHQFDHGANVGVVRDAPRARPLLVGKDWMRVDAASFAQLAPELLRKRKMGGAVAVHVTDLAPDDSNAELAARSWAGGDARR